MNFIDRFLSLTAKIQFKFAIPIAILVILFTIFMGVGVTKVRMQSDMSKEMPTELPIFQLNDKITDKFGGQDSIFILFTLDTTNYKEAPDDIRDPAIIDYLVLLENTLVRESAVENVLSVGTYLSAYSYSTTDDVISLLEGIPASSYFISDDYKTTFMIIRVDVGESEKKTIQVTELIQDKLNSLALPSGVKVMVTGTPPLRVTLLSILQSDALYTISLASLIILLLLFIMEKSITKGFLIFIPLFLGLVWTMGIMGWLGIMLSIATVGIGAMILGLGVEYGVFMYTRYKEERDKGKDQLNSLMVAVPAIGASVLGSGTTTIVGFLALTLSSFPMLQHLGSTLALGIAACLVAAVFISPVVFILEERFEKWYKCKLFDIIEKDVAMHRSEYKEIADDIIQKRQMKKNRKRNIK